jgi:Pvc16 N-terminal domain
VKADGILKVTLALKKRLEKALTASTVPGSVFVGPLDDPDVGNAALILFLYRIVPNATLRNSEHRVPSPVVPPPVQVFRSPLPLDLYFLVTVGTRGGSEGEQQLLQALGFAMQFLHAEAELTGADVSHETVRVTLEPLTTEEVSRIWALFPTANYRTTVAYLATPVWLDPPEPEPLARPVVEDSLFAGDKVTEAVV